MCMFPGVQPSLPALVWCVFSLGVSATDSRATPQVIGPLHRPGAPLSYPLARARERAGLFLPRPVFSHGQLDVAFSRLGDPPSAGKGVRVVAVEVEGAQGNLKGTGGRVFTRNVAYREVVAG